MRGSMLQYLRGEVEIVVERPRGKVGLVKNPEGFSKFKRRRDIMMNDV